MLDLLPTILSALAGATSTLVYCAWQLSAFSYRLKQVEVETMQLKARHDSDMIGLASQLDSHRREVIGMVQSHDEHNRQDFNKLQQSIDAITRMLVEGRR